MTTYIVAYLTTAVVFFAIDFVWLSNAVKIYRSGIGHLMADKPDFIYAAVFYVLYVIGIVIFAVSPALQQGSWQTALLFGALLGFFCYGTYDFTNIATLRDWPLWVTLMDVTWGTVLTGASATAGYLLTRAILG